MARNAGAFTTRDCLCAFERAYLSHVCQQLTLIQLSGRRNITFRPKDFPGTERVFLLGGIRRPGGAVILLALADDHDESESSPEWRDDPEDDRIRRWKLVSTRYSPALTISAPGDRLPKIETSTETEESRYPHVLKFCELASMTGIVMLRDGAEFGIDLAHYREYFNPASLWAEIVCDTVGPELARAPSKKFKNGARLCLDAFGASIATLKMILGRKAATSKNGVNSENSRPLKLEVTSKPNVPNCTKCGHGRMITVSTKQRTQYRKCNSCGYCAKTTKRL